LEEGELQGVIESIVSHS